MVPFVVRSSFQRSKWGPVLLALGIAFSFSISTYIIATSGQLLGLTPDKLKIFSGLFLLIASVLFIFPKFTVTLSRLFAPINNKLQIIGQNKLQGSGSDFIEFLNGLVLGPIWAPCSGPALAIIIGIIINNPEAKTSILLLAIFSIGSFLPIVFFSYGAKSIVLKVQKKSLENSNKMEMILGVFCGVMAICILTGFDKTLETFLLSFKPEFLTNLSISI